MSFRNEGIKIENSGFYMYFDVYKKREYYVTSIYPYNIISTCSLQSDVVTLELEKAITKNMKLSEKSIRSYPFDITVPYIESIGAMLINFLNSNIDSFEDFYNNFLCKYGYELLLENSTSEIPKKDTYTEIELFSILKSLYKDSYPKLKTLQKNYRDFVDFIYNLNGNKSFPNSKPLSKFIASLVKRKYKINWYPEDLKVIFDAYDKKYNSYYFDDLKTIIDKVDKNSNFVKINDIYSSTHLSTFLFLILERIVNSDSIKIKQCQRCGRYFIPAFRQSEVYCDFPNLDGTPTCRSKGAAEMYKKTLEDNPALLKYRRTYQQKFMIADRNKDNPKLRQEFDIWKKKAQAKVKLFKQGKMTEEELYNWIAKST